MSKQHKKGLGQYFTIAEELQQFVFDTVKHRGSRLLEPSFGAGHLLKKFKEYDSDYPMVCYELDTTITPIIEFSQPHQTVIYGDFTKQSITENFKTIIGNPPYVQQKKTGNMYIKFISALKRSSCTSEIVIRFLPIFLKKKLQKDQVICFNLENVF